MERPNLQVNLLDEWFAKKLTTFDRASGKIYNTQVVGANPSHVMPNPLTGTLYVALTGEDRVLKLTPCEYPTALASINVGPHSGPASSASVLADPKDGQITANNGMGGRASYPYRSPTLAF